MNEIVCALAEAECGAHVAKRLVCLAAKGACTVTTDEGKIKLSKGEVFIVPPKTEYVLSGTASILELKYPLSYKKPKKISDAYCGIAFAAEQAVLYKNAKKSDLILSALADLVSAYLTAFAPDDLSPIVLTVKGEILKNVSNPFFSLDGYLKSLPLNGEYVRRLFKRETGVTPHKFLTDERMKLAKFLLSGGGANQYSKYSVAQVAESCGMAEPLYFSRLFKKYFGVSPSAYVKQIKITPQT